MSTQKYQKPTDAELEILQRKYRDLTEQAYRLSTKNRRMSDEKAFEAEEIMKQIVKFEK